MTNTVEVSEKVTTSTQPADNPEWLKKLLAEKDVIDERPSHADYRKGPLDAVILLAAFTICFRLF